MKDLSKDEREKKMKELKVELIKAKGSQTGSSKPKEIRKIIARLNTITSKENLEGEHKK